MGMDRFVPGSSSPSFLRSALRNTIGGKNLALLFAHYHLFQERLLKRNMSYVVIFRAAAICGREGHLQGLFKPLA